MIDEIDHVSKKKKKKGRHCGGFCEVVFLQNFFGLELRMRMLKRHEGCHFSSGVGGMGS